jgi:hypothetical protein
MPARAGLKCTLHVNTAAYANPTWSEVKNVRNPGIPKGKEMAEVTTRRHGGYKAFIGTLKEFGLEFEMNADDADPNYTAFEDSYWTNTIVDVLVLRGAKTAGMKGVRMQMEVETFDEKQDQNGAVVTTVKLVIGEPAADDTPVVERYTEPGS